MWAGECKSNLTTQVLVAPALSYKISLIIHLDTKYLMVKTLAGTLTLSTCSLQMQRFLLPFRPYWSFGNLVSC